MDPESGSTGGDDFLSLDRASDRRRFWNRVGLSSGAERYLTGAGAVLLGILALGWIWSISRARETAETSEGEVAPTAVGAITAALTNRDAPSTAYLTNAALDAFTERMLGSQLGKSGK